MSNQPQPAWEQNFDTLVTPPKYRQDLQGTECLMCGFPFPHSKGNKLMKDFIRSLLATERSKLIAEARRKIDTFEIKGNTKKHKEYWIGYNSAVGDIAVQLFPLTPPPKGETI